MYNQNIYIIILISVLFIPNYVEAAHTVGGYFRHNGTYVEPHMSMDPGESQSTGMLITIIFWFHAIQPRLLQCPLQTSSSNQLTLHLHKTIVLIIQKLIRNGIFINQVITLSLT